MKTEKHSQISNHTTQKKWNYIKKAFSGLFFIDDGKCQEESSSFIQVNVSEINRDPLRGEKNIIVARREDESIVYLDF